MRPRLRKGDKTEPPFPLNEYSKSVVLHVAKSMLASLFSRQTDSFEGSDWERTFAEAIGAEWKPSNLGLDDIALGNCCWGAKSVKASKPHEATKVRLISGRNSPTFSYGVKDIGSVKPNDLGEMVLSIWNERVDIVRKRFASIRTAVLLKGDGLLSGCVFEFDTVRFVPDEFRWAYNAQNNLEGRTLEGQHKFTWQPHGSQFTVVEDVPEKRYCFTITPPEAAQGLSKEAILDAIGYDDSWVKIH